ncbi:SRPBCC family protein [Longispora sp. K20-0274]|uniref:SRPBCC family protein n=1 Tax=Longispora sp. K20-0274 TaxID=3088255 RepID=UPI00399A6E60
MSEDRIEREISIKAPVGRVWAVLTEPEHVGQWFGQGEPTAVDLRPGGEIFLDHGEYGQFRAVVVAAEPERYLSYRWASAFPGELATEDNATLVEFTLRPDGDGTLLTLVESGFARLNVPAGSNASHASHSDGWGHVLGKLVELAQA